MSFDPMQWVQTLARAITEHESREARRVVLEWLPRGLRWLVDHPRLLRFYMRLPHRTAPTCVVKDGVAEWKIVKLR